MSKCRIALGLHSYFSDEGSLSLFKIDRIHYFDIRYSLFDIRYSLFQSFFLDHWTLAASGAAHVKSDAIFKKYLTAEHAASGLSEL